MEEVSFGDSRFDFNQVTQMDLIPGLPDDIGLECLIRVPYQDISSVASVCRSWKCKIELPEFWLFRKASGISRKVVVMVQSRVDSKQLLGCDGCAKKPLGYRVTLWEPETGYRTELPPLPGYPHGLPMFCQLVGVGLNLVVMGGVNRVTWKVSNDVLIYNFVSATWCRGTSMPGCQRLFFACASDSNGTVFVAGGDDGKYMLKSAMVYEVAEDKWVALPEMARGFTNSIGLFSQGKFHVISRHVRDEQDRFKTSVVSFDVANWQWGTVQEDFLNGLLFSCKCAVDGDGKIFMSRDADVVALQGSTWQVVAKLPFSVRNISCMIAWQGKVLVIGTQHRGPGYKGFLLDLKSSKWESFKKR